MHAQPQPPQAMVMPEAGQFNAILLLFYRHFVGILTSFNAIYCLFNEAMPKGERIASTEALNRILVTVNPISTPFQPHANPISTLFRGDRGRRALLWPLHHSRL